MQAAEGRGGGAGEDSAAVAHGEVTPQPLPPQEPPSSFIHFYFIGSLVFFLNLPDVKLFPIFFSPEGRANKHVRVVSVTVETLRGERKSLVFLLSIFHHLMSFMT